MSERAGRAARRPRARTPAALVVEARAKLNLGLAVGPRRADGFHDIATVFQSVSLADTLILRRRRRGFTLAIRRQDAALPRARPARRSHRARRPGGSADAVPAGGSNLVLRAARLLRERAGLDGGAGIRLIKRIPERTGLGGASADAAATLVGLARLHRLEIRRERLLELAAELGSDVPFALRGGTALGLGRGERLVRLRLGRGFRALIAVPRWRIATALAYRRWDRGKYGLTGWSAKLRFAQSLAGEELNPESALRLGNAFEQVLGARRYQFDSLCRRLRDAGVEGLRMTGSGSAVFGLLGLGTSATTVARRFLGTERLFMVRSVRSALRITPYR
jgi:4-diphosphocytidyl-2-C-methyl-D-erythritol kinase